MAQKPIREYHSKKLLFKHLPEFLPDYSFNYQGLLIDESNLNQLDKLKWKKIVAKPDQLFGKRGKNNLVFISDDKDEVKKWIKDKMNQEARIKKHEGDNGILGTLTHFLIEPAIEHKTEYYLAIKTERDHDVIYFSEAGGIDVEENWDKVIEFKIPFKLTNESIEPILIRKSKIENRKLISFISANYQLFKKLNFTYLELNPFVIEDDLIVPLDMVARLDSTAEYDNEEEWMIDSEIIEFPKPFGMALSELEKEVEKLDLKTSSSLKLTILNPNGRIWLLTAGGGASVIFADTVADLGAADELGNYGEYSGDPTTDETEAYCNYLFEAMFASKAKDKVLIIGGGIANFTDVAATFKGIIKAIDKNQEKFRKQNIAIFVRRAGPNYARGLKLIKEAVEPMGIKIKVNGPEMHMTRVVKEALK